jgi:hypothetical protein
MRNKAILSLSIAAVSFSLALPAMAQSTDQPSGGACMKGPTGQREAMRIVPAQVALEKGLDAGKEAVGFQFRAILSSNVHLDNGVELPHGTLLMGMIATDDMNTAGAYKLAIRFTQAVLKNGTIVPIKATIVGAYKPGADETGGEYPIPPGEQVPNNWNDGTLQVDQIGVSKDVDLHSKIASRNSGVFISTSGHAVKLPAGSELALAIAQQTPRQIAESQNR